MAMIRGTKRADRIDGGGAEGCALGLVGEGRLGSHEIRIGGAGDDEPGSGASLLPGGTVFDLASWWTGTAAVLVELSRGFLEARGAGASNRLAGIEGASGWQAEAATGGPGDDFLTGGPRADRLRGQDGADHLRGLAGDDRLEGGAGDDLLEGGSGDDLLDGGKGADRIQGGSGDDRILGSGGDHIDGGPGRDRVDYGAYDTPGAIWFQREPFRFPEFGAGIRVELAPLAQGDAPESYATDTLTRIEDVSGSRLDDVMFGDRRDNRFEGRGGDDRLVGEAGNDVLIGGAGRDQLEGGAGHDRLEGGAGDDVLFGGEGFDTAVWSERVGAVRLSFNAAPREIWSDDRGGWGDGFAYPTGLLAVTIGGQTDLVDGIERFVFAGEGFSLAQLARRVGGITVGSEANETIVARETLVLAMDGNDRVAGTGRAETLVGGAGDDRIDGFGGPDRITGDGGDDRLEGGAGDDRIDGGEGADVIDGGAGNDVLEGGRGPTEPFRGFDEIIDTVRYASATRGVVVDMSLGDAPQDTQGAGIDRLSGFERLEGSRFADRLHGFDAQIGAFNFGKPIVDGGAGDDVIVSGLASEVLIGGAGRDRFVWTELEPFLLPLPEEVQVELTQDQLDLTAFDLAPADLTLEAGAAPDRFVLRFEGFAVELVVAEAAFAGDVAAVRGALDSGVLLL